MQGQEGPGKEPGGQESVRLHCVPAGLLSGCPVSVSVLPFLSRQ